MRRKTTKNAIHHDEGRIAICGVLVTCACFNNNNNCRYYDIWCWLKPRSTLRYKVYFENGIYLVFKIVHFSSALPRCWIFLISCTKVIRSVRFSNVSAFSVALNLIFLYIWHFIPYQSNYISFFSHSIISTFSFKICLHIISPGIRGYFSLKMIRMNTKWVFIKNHGF